MFSSAQKLNHRFENLVLKDGLSQSQVNGILQDSKGFIWIATQDGLNRYDGYDFKVFKNDMSKENSLSGNYIYSIAHCKDELWVATDKGLNKFEFAQKNITRYYYDPLDKNSIANNLTRSLFIDRDTNIWVGSVNGKISVFNNKSKTFERLITLPSTTQIKSFFEDIHGNIWAATEGDGIVIMTKKGKFIQTIGVGSGLKSNSIHAFYYDREHHLLWVGSNAGLDLFKIDEVDQQFKLKPVTLLPEHQISSSVTCVLKDKSGHYWVGTEGKGLAQVVIDNITGIPISVFYFKHNPLIQYSLVDNIIYSLFQDPNGVIWVGTSNGLSKINPGKQFFSHVYNIPDEKNSLANNIVWAICEDSKGKVWVGTREGLNGWEPDLNKFDHYPLVSNTLSYKANSSVLSVFEDKNQNLWLGTVDQLIRAERDKDNKIIAFKQFYYWGKNKNESIENKIYKIFESSKGVIYVGTKYGLGIINQDKNNFQFYTEDISSSDSPPLSFVRDINEDSAGNVWLGTESGLYQIQYVNKKHEFIKYSSLISGFNDQVTSILPVKEGVLWTGTYGGGIVEVNTKSNTIRRFTEEDGLSNNVVYGVLSDKTGNIWVSTNKGISVFEKSTEKFKVYSEEDGLQSNEFNTGAYFKNQDGIMYFGGINGFNRFDPRKISISSKPPRPVIIDFKIFNKSIADMNVFKYTDAAYISSIKLKYNQNNITIDFAGLHYSTQGKNRHFYKLVGFDSDWIESENNRTANYNNLSPGEYEFLLKTCNGDNLCNAEPLKLKVVIIPATWQTWWFRSILIIFIISLVILGFRTRINIVRKQNQALELLVDRRTREVMRQKELIEDQKKELEHQKKISEDLLKNILPQQTVEELKSKGRVRARNFKLATVMFTDFKGFTQIAEDTNPKDLLEELDEYFKRYDEIMEVFHVEKIKTIGDSYMCVGGIPVRNRTNPYEVVLAALEIQNYMSEVKEQKIERGEKFWEVRIGIHTGPLIAGVIGTRRLAYDIWGDTVNVSNRMEMTCLEGKINISGQTYQFIKDFFVCTYRGKIQAKNKGEIDMYFVDSIKEEFSKDGLGRRPNDKFWEAMNTAVYGSVLHYKRVERSIINKLKTELAENLYYHCLEHTLDVCNAVERLAISEGLNQEEIILLKTAALYHDAGFIVQYSDNELIGAKMAEEELPRYGYTEEQIEKIVQLIKATAMPQVPQDKLSKILCDGDLDYLGREDFLEISDRLKKEYMERKIVKNNIEWDALQIKFLSQHKYFTETALEMREAKKQQNLLYIKKRYQNYLYG